jgi:hypothetical protein
MFIVAPFDFDFSAPVASFLFYTVDWDCISCSAWVITYSTDISFGFIWHIFAMRDKDSILYSTIEWLVRVGIDCSLWLVWKCFDYVLKQNPLLHTTVEKCAKQEPKWRKLFANLNESRNLHRSTWSRDGLVGTMLGVGVSRMVGFDVWGTVVDYSINNSDSIIDL